MQNNGKANIMSWQVLMVVMLLLPISIGDEDAISINYSFILLLNPFFFRKNDLIWSYIIFITISFFIGLIIFSGFESNFVTRQTASYLVYLFAVLLSIAKLNFQLKHFILSIVIVSVGYSLITIYEILINNFSLRDIYNIKSGLRDFVPDWPQRFVIVLIFGQLICISNWRISLLWQSSALIITACIFLTFTRAAWLAAMIAVITYFLTTRHRKKIKNKKNAVRLTSLMLIVISGYLVATSELVQNSFFSIVNRFFAATQNTSIADSSEGTRIEIWIQIYDIITINPFTGTGFAGAGLIVEGAGSAHNQYMDVLLRTGIIGLIFYLIFWVFLMRHFFKENKLVFSYLFALFVYGFFHETTKLSYGAFIFFVLVNFMINKPTYLYGSKS